MAINEQIVLSARNQARAAFRDLEGDARKTAGAMSQRFGQAGQGLRKFSTEFNGPFMSGLQRGKVGMGDFNQIMEKAAGQAGLGTSQFSRLAGATGLYKDQQLLAARASAEAAAKAQQLTQAVAAGTMTTREAGKAWGEYARQSEVAGAKSGGLIGQIGGVVGKLTLITGAAIAAGAAINKGMDFAEAGAGLERLNISGQQLAQGLGGSYDTLMNKLRSASLQTISNAELMLSANRAMMLGLGGDADKLAGLMEVAAFRGRAMGLTTTQAFSDIVTGIGRASPQILDNLGIVLDAENAYAVYALQLGKTAEQLTKSEKMQALLNATLEDGLRQIKAAGGLAADNATKFERWHTASANLADAWKTRLAPAGAAVAEVLTRLLTAQKENVDGTRFVTMLVDGELRAYQRIGGELIDKTDLYNQLRAALDEATQSQAGYIAEVDGAAQGQQGFNAEVEKTAGLLAAIGTDGGLSGLRLAEGTDEAMRKFNFQLEVRNRRLEEAKKKAEDAQRPIKGVLDLMSGEMSSPIKSFIEDLKWFQAGGWKIEAAFEALKTGLASGAISPEEADKFAAELYVATEDVQVELGKLNIDDAAANIATTLGITVEDAKTRLLGTEGIQGALDKLTTTEWRINIMVNYVGDLPPGLTVPGTGVQKPTKPTQQRTKPGKVGKAAYGMNMTIPPGYNENGGNPFWIATSSGEHVVVDPDGNRGGGGGDVYVGEINVVTQGDPGEAYAEVSRALADQVRSARAGAGYSGM